MALTEIQQHFTKLYLASFKRAPELGGLNYWSNEFLVQGKSLQTVGGTIFSLPTILEIYPADLSDSEFVEAVYLNVFGRASDAEGLAYWTNEIATLRQNFTNQGSTNAVYEARGQLAMTMIEAGMGAPDGSEGKAYIENRLAVVEYAVEMQLKTDVEITPQELLAIELTVSEDVSTIDGAMDAVDRWVYDIIAPTQTAEIILALDGVGSKTGGVVNNGSTDDADPKLQGTLTAPLAAGERLVVYRDNTEIGAATVTDKNWTFEDKQLGLGWHTYHVRVVDQAGNQGAVSPFFRINIEAQVDTTPPSLEKAEVNGTLLTLTYSEALNDSSDAAIGSFVVNVGGNPVVVSAADAVGSTVKLTLSTAVNNGQSVTLSYTPPNVNPTKDIAGNKAAALNNQFVTNVTPPSQNDTTVPELESVVVNADGYIVALTYNEQLNGDVNVSPSGFVVNDVNGSIPVDSVSVGGNSVVLVLKGYISTGGVATVSYMQPVDNPIKDSAGNLAMGFVDKPVATSDSTGDVTSPVLLEAVANGNQISLTYNEALDPGAVPGQYFFEYRDAATKEQFNASSYSFDGATIVLNFDEAVKVGQNIEVFYQVFSSMPPFLQDFSGNLVDFIYWMPVTNITGQGALDVKSLADDNSSGVDLIGSSSVQEYWVY